MDKEEKGLRDKFHRILRRLGYDLSATDEGIAYSAYVKMVRGA